MRKASLQFYQPLSPNPLVLIVEPDEDTRLMMKYLLQMWSYRVSDTAHLEEALQITATQQPDVVLLCGRDSTGEIFSAVRRMREASLFDNMGIFFISAFSQTAIRAAVLDAGADEFLIKPIDFGHLENLLERRLIPKYAGRGLF